MIDAIEPEGESGDGSMSIRQKTPYLDEQIGREVFSSFLQSKCVYYILSTGLSEF